MDGWNGHTYPVSGFSFIKCFQKNGVCAGRSTWRVWPWHGCGSEYLEGTAEELRYGHVRLTIVFLQEKGVFPFPREF
jgi:hypothetical protein